MPVLGEAPVVNLDPTEYCYKNSRGQILDESGNVCEERKLVSDYGFGNYRTLEYQIEACF